MRDLGYGIIWEDPKERDLPTKVPDGKGREGNESRHLVMAGDEEEARVGCPEVRSGSHRARQERPNGRYSHRIMVH